MEENMIIEEAHEPAHEPANDPAIEDIEMNHEENDDEDVNSILNDTLPGKNHSKYLKTWDDFKTISGFNEEESREKPSCDMFLKFFHHMKTKKAYAKSSLWVLYSYLNSILQRRYNSKLQDYPQVSILLKSYPNKEPKQSNIFSINEIKEFLSHDMSTERYWLLRQAVVVLAYFGGMRMVEVRKNRNYNLNNFIF